MARFLQFAVVALAAVVLVHAHHGQGSQAGSDEESADSRTGRSGWGQQQGRSSGAGWGAQQRGNSGWQGQQGRSNDDQGLGQQGSQQGRNQQGFGGRQGGAEGRYVGNIFDDEDVYGYEAKYPGGEALYVNYRNSDARARRGPSFARSNSISSRMNGGSSGQRDQWNGQQDGQRQQRGAANSAGARMQPMQQPQW